MGDHLKGQKAFMPYVTREERENGTGERRSLKQGVSTGIRVREDL
jgi:hypothetical protein